MDDVLVTPRSKGPSHSSVYQFSLQNVSRLDMNLLTITPTPFDVEMRVNEVLKMFEGALDSIYASHYALSSSVVHSRKQSEAYPAHTREGSWHQALECGLDRCGPVRSNLASW